MSHTFFSLGFVFGGFKNKSDVCHVLCEELFMSDGRPHSQADVGTEFVVVSLTLLVYTF